MDAAADFLHRHERRAIDRRRKREPLRAVAPVVVAAEAGLLALTPTRWLLATRGRWRVRVVQWRRSDIGSIRSSRTGHGHLAVVLRSGRRVRLDFTSRDAFDSVQRALERPVASRPAAGQRTRSARRGQRAAAPPARQQAAPFQVDRASAPQPAAGTHRMAPAAAAGPPSLPVAAPDRVARPRAPPSPDPLAHRGTPAHEARLRHLHAQGVLTKAELEWQLER